MGVSAMTKRAVLTIARLRDDFVDYAERCLKILTKKGDIVPLKLNRAQRYAHSRIEAQLRTMGKVRAVVLKGRQQGLSTYITARFYHKASGEFGKRVQIMTHLDEATENLFNMVKNYHELNNVVMKPRVRVDNAKELTFSALKTTYRVTTAGSKGTGRSATAQYFHWSEMAFSPQAKKHMAGIGQIVPNEDGTEIIIESTANGIGDPFHSKVMEALSGRGDYMLIFIPWFWEDGYTRPCPPDFGDFTADEIEYGETYKLDQDRLYWRHRKIHDEFEGDDTLFDQEYPADVAMAFAAGTKKALIKPAATARAMANADAPDDSDQALVLGVDPGEYGDDPTAMTLRRGHKVLWSREYPKEGNAEIAGRVMMLVEEHEMARDPIDAIFVDVGGVGTGVESILSSNKVRNVYRIHFGSKAILHEKYHDRSAEMWSRTKEWLDDKDNQASIPADDYKLQLELSSRDFSYDTKRRVVLETKEHMRDNGKASPNKADSLVLTFALPVTATGRRRNRETLSDRLRTLLARKKADQRRG